LKTAPFTLYRVENVITTESAKRGDYESSEPTETEDADLREALDALDSDCWDNVDLNGVGTIICYPADYSQNYRTGAWEADQLIIHARRPEWAERLLDVWEARNRKDSA
jgi:hypothetical protein